MILVFEMTWTGAIHAPGNSATLQVLAHAFPGEEVRMHAEVTHLDELRRDTALMALPNVRLKPIELSPHCRWRTHPVSFRRLLREFRTVRTALAAAPPGEPCLVFLISTTATGTFAAAWAAWLDGLRSGRRIGVQVGFHGNLNDATGWRPRNPLRRALDTRSAIEARHPVPTRFLVLEGAIRTALATLIPIAAECTDVVPLPINTAELATAAGGRLGSPLRVGFVGLGTKAKGIDTFLAIAGRLRARWGRQVEFVHVGCMPQGADLTDHGILADPPSSDGLSRADFEARLASLHYVFLPFRSGYYDLSASGALIDALTWLKPLITSRVPLTEQFFAEYGDIGVLCEDEAGLEAALGDILSTMDAARYDGQVTALRSARGQRRVEVLARRYRVLVEAGFPGLLRPEHARPLAAVPVIAG